jgi:hypothetical protein
MSKQNFVPLNNYREFSESEMLERSESFYNHIRTRRTVRDFSQKSFPVEVIQNCIKAAGTAPNGANM